MYVDAGGAVARSTGAGGYYNYPSRIADVMSGCSIGSSARRTESLDPPGLLLKPAPSDKVEQIKTTKSPAVVLIIGEEFGSFVRTL